MWLFVAVLAGLYLLRRWHRERQRVPDLANKYVLITGCDSGFGSLLVRVLNVNLVGLVEVTLSLLPLVRRARGRVVNVASILGRLAFYGGGYCPSKYGVEAFSDSLRREMRPFGVQVSVMEPGGFRTGMTDPRHPTETLERLWEELPEETQAAYGRHYLQACREKSSLAQKQEDHPKIDIPEKPDKLP
nr:PREDICTED: 17-beta-hydroxysteroid dehydrogenase type 6-like [Apteryx mantelli mantelli]